MAGDRSDSDVYSMFAFEERRLRFTTSIRYGTGRRCVTNTIMHQFLEISLREDRNRFPSLETHLLRFVCLSHTSS